MYYSKPKKTPIVIIIIMGLAVLCGGLLYIGSIEREISLYANSKESSEEFFDAYTPSPFINNAAYRAPDSTADSRGEALFFFETPEGFDIVSYSQAWDEEMLELLYHELKCNTHGKEIEKLSEIVIHGYEDDEMSARATYSPGINPAEVHIRFPALGEDFSVGFPAYTGTINVYGGDTKTTIESIAGSLAHEYGHHYTMYYMFSYNMREQGRLDESEYGMLRRAQEYDLIPYTDVSEEYTQQRHRYIVEIAAEDYVTLMGSPTTRQTADYYDVKQLTDDSELAPDRYGERNAFPQENMSIPLGTDVEGLAEYFYSFIDEEPRLPAEEKQEITLDFDKQTETFNLSTGSQAYVYYTVTWNTPYKDAIYTLACFDPFDYKGFGHPIKTVRPGRRATTSASAVIGNYAVRRRSTVYSLDDGLTSGIKTFYVVAQLPDGTYYMSELHEFNFG